MKRYLTALCLALSSFCLMALPGCGGSQGEKPEPPELSVGLMPDTDSIPFLIAQEKGYFADEGVKVALHPFKSAMDRDSALQSGNLDGAVSDLLAAAFAKDGGFDVGVTSFTDGNYCLIGGKSENGASIRDLRDKEVAVSKNTIIEYVTDQILRKAQMEGTDIRKVIIPQIPARLEMLQNGKLAAATLPEPMASIAVANGCRYITSAEELGINPGVVLFTQSAIRDKRDGIQALYRAYNRAVKYLNETNPAEYMGLVLEKGGFPPGAKDALHLPKYHEAAPPKESDVADCMAWLHAKGLIKENYAYKDIVADLQP